MNEGPEGREYDQRANPPTSYKVTPERAQQLNRLCAMYEDGETIYDMAQAEHVTTGTIRRLAERYHWRRPSGYRSRHTPKIKWTEERDRQLHDLNEQGLTDTLIASEMGLRASQITKRRHVKGWTKPGYEKD